MAQYVGESLDPAFVERSLLMEDVGDVLGDESLAEVFDPVDFILMNVLMDFILAPCDPIASVEVEDGEAAFSGRTFYSLIDSRTNVDCQHWLSTALSFLCFRIGWPHSSVAEKLCTLIAESHLRSLGVFVQPLQHAAQMVNEVVDALQNSPSCIYVENLMLVCTGNAALSEHLASFVRFRCRSLFLTCVLDFDAAEEADGNDYFYKLLSNLLTPDTSSDHCKLLELRLGTDLENKFFRYMSGMSRALNERLAASNKLTRLDLRGMPPLLGADEMTLLLTFVASPSCSIHDLGLCSFNWFITSEDQKERGKESLCIAAYSSSFVKAFRSGPSLGKLKALRFSGVKTKKGAACVVEALACPAGQCNVRFIDIQVVGFRNIDAIFQRLHKATARIEGLRITYIIFDDNEYKRAVPNLSQFLGWENCSLLWLQCMPLHAGYYITAGPLPEPLQLEMANALETNYLITSLHLPLTSLAARSRAAAFLTRNRLYQSMGFSPIKEGVKPQVGRLFVCGNGEVGKTTLCKALLKLQSQRPYPSTSSTQLPSAAFFNKMLQMCRRSIRCTNPELEPRTRGLEIRQLCFQPSQKLVIFDLGGQEDYHVFHHYMVANTSHDLFIIVCKFINDSSPSQLPKLDAELDYWLKFIVSHRNSVRGPNPKVMLVVNFFSAATGSLARSLSSMEDTAQDITTRLRGKYAQHLDFGDGHGQVHGIVARTTSQAKPILDKLEVLLQELLDRRPMIPTLCNDLLSHTLPQLAAAGDHQKKLSTCTGFELQCKKAPAKKVIVDYAKVKEHYMQQQDPIPLATSREFSILEKKLQAALVELHNVGAVVFFPPPKMQGKPREIGANNAPLSTNSETLVASTSSNSPTDQDMATCVITNPDWFCNKIVGDLFAPLEMEGKSVWSYTEIRHLIKDSGCPRQYVEAILRYMLSSEFCYAIRDNVDQTCQFFFPAVANTRSIHRPHIFNKGNTSFYGRRIKCKETDRHLIPSGVFARLQVRLQTFSTVDNDPTYKMGYHWASFVKDTVGVMVRFGRIASDQSQSTTVSAIHMEKDDHPQWIDILLCFLCLDNVPHQATIASTIMHDIKKHIFDICQATSKGIPTVKLEELVVRHEAHDQDVRPLVEVQDYARKNGLQSHIGWASQVSTPVVDLMLPEELKVYVINHVQILQEIRKEFALEEGKDAELRKEEGDPYKLQVPQEQKVLYDLLLKLSGQIKSLDAKVGSVLEIVKEIKKDVGKVMDSLQKAQLDIVANCSTRLLRQLAQGVLPSYPYLTDSTGKMQKIKSSLLHKTAKLHLLCESGPHVVKGQLGKDVVVERGILMKMAPLLVPALKVLCCAARFAANAYVPGVASLLFGDFNYIEQFLKPIGISENDLESAIMAKALNTIFDGLDVKIQHLFDSKAEIQADHAGQTRQEAVEAIQKMLGSIEELDMERDFGLYLVRVGENQARWLCNEHISKEDTKFSPQPRNPFSSAK